jgi:Ca-activated chloride channel family protein
MKRLFPLLGALAALIVASPASAIGILVPTDTSLPPLAIESHRVEVNIKDRTAETKVVQVFKNSTSRVLEATYTFPLPKGASVSDFALWMDGKRVSGEVLEKEKAREIYQGIVSRMKDPGLLEYIGNDIFQAKIYPIPANGTQKVEISFTTILSREGGVSQYTYPLKTGGTSATTLADFTMTVKIESKTPIKSVYSPSHTVYVNKKDDNHAVVGFEFDKATLEKDFQLYYSLSKDEVGVDLLTYKKKGEDGYFMLMVSPKKDYAESEIIGKHVTFVIDTSGSMSGEKMERARKALIYCLQNLRDDDTFSIIRFSSDVESFEKEPKPATKEWVTKAVNFASKMEAAGGTAIYDSLQEALKIKTKSNAPNIIVFLTDGSPTIGETDPKKIAEATARANAGSARIFVFGVGETVNAILLDQIAADNGGFAEYAKPDAEVETVLTAFYNKIAYPVLANLSLEIPKVKTKDLFPRAMGDLYRGQQVLLFGRYKDIGGTTISLIGNVEGKSKKFEYEGEFPDENLSNDFIPRLWATRKVGYLLEEIRSRGEQPEVREEVIRLAKEFGIVTPYTSYLVVEDTTTPVATPNNPQPMPVTPVVPRWSNEEAERASGSDSVIIDAESTGRGNSGGIFKRDGDGLFSGKKGKKVSPSAMAPEKPREKSQDMSKSPEPTAAIPPPDYNASTGASGIAASKENKNRKEAQKGEENGYSNFVDGRNFLWNGSGWVDATFTASMKTISIAPMSDAYFLLLKLRPDLAKGIALGNEVVLVISKDKAIIITASGKSSMTEKDISAFVK